MNRPLLRRQSRKGCSRPSSLQLMPSKLDVKLPYRESLPEVLALLNAVFRTLRVLVPLARLPSLVVLLTVGLVNSSGAQSQVTPDIQKEAIEYVRSFPNDTPIFVWPTFFRPFEHIGALGNEVNDAITEYNKSRREIVMIGGSLLPQISMVVYEGDVNAAKTEFSGRTKLPSSYAEHVVALNIGSDACAFTKSISRNTWASSSVIFLDASRIKDARSRERCILTALDYLNGFPMHSDDGYLDVPDSSVRQLVLSSILNCSRLDARSGAGAEISRDGFSPLPSISCVIESISEL